MIAVTVGEQRKSEKKIDFLIAKCPFINLHCSSLMILYISRSRIQYYPLLFSLVCLPSHSLQLLFSPLGAENSVFVENSTVWFNEDQDQSENGWIVMTMIYATKRKGEEAASCYKIFNSVYYWLNSLRKIMTSHSRENLLHSSDLQQTPTELSMKTCKVAKSHERYSNPRIPCFSGPLYTSGLKVKWEHKLPLICDLMTSTL